MIYQATPDYYNDVIQHYGVKGMKWRKHKLKNPYAGKVKSAYDSNRKNRQMVAAGKKNIKKHNINKRVQKWVESDNAVYARALKNARRTIKRRKSN